MALETMVIPRQCVAEVSRCALAAILAAVPRTLALCDVVLPPLGICKTRLARRLGLSRYQLSQILAEKRFSHERNGFEAGVRCGRVGAIVDGNGGGLR